MKSQEAAGAVEAEGAEGTVKADDAGEATIAEEQATFEAQMRVNHVSQLSEMATSVTEASNTALADMSRNVKG
jgi:hypothetical protein